jgi:mRNA-degrading endonuclease RelE of RelBE toxin-antitoxin system
VRLAFIESRAFSEQLRLLAPDEAYRAFQNELQENPEKGDLVPGACGVRKVRMRVPGRGKRGGARVIYLYLQNHGILYFLTLYTKSAQADLAPDQKKAICAVVEEIKRAHRDSV